MTIHNPGADEPTPTYRLMVTHGDTGPEHRLLFSRDAEVGRAARRSEAGQAIGPIALQPHAEACPPSARAWCLVPGAAQLLQ